MIGCSDMKLLACSLWIFTATAIAQNAPAPVAMTADEKRFADSMVDVALVGYYSSGDKAEFLLNPVLVVED